LPASANQADRIWQYITLRNMQSKDICEILKFFDEGI